MEKTIEIPEGYKARIEGNKVILELKESEDERIRKELILYFENKKRTQEEAKYYQGVEGFERWIAWLEKQGNTKMSAEALREGVAHYGITQYQIDNWLKKYVEVESTEPKSSAWSEEDEKIKCSLVYLIEEIIRQPLKRHEDWKGYIAWLKSLKERYTWKPSDEQIKAIRLARAFVTDDFDEHPSLSEILVELEEQLKKLKG